MINTKFICLITLTITLALGLPLAAQVQTDVTPVVPGAKPVTVRHIKVHGTALEDSLERDAVDRDVFVFLPPSYASFAQKVGMGHNILSKLVRLLHNQ